MTIIKRSADTGMNILVSSCLMGSNCKYNGGNNLNKRVVHSVQGHNVIEICPELLAGMACPRECVELVNGVIMSETGRNLDAEYRRGVAIALESIEDKHIHLAILQSRSPTCGVNAVYDGTFTGRLVLGQGLLTQALKERGIKVMDAEDV